MLPGLLLAAAVTAPALLPPDDVEFKHCIDASHGVRLEWQRPAGDVGTFLLVKRLTESGEWRPWLKTERAYPPFTLTMKSALARHGKFAWMLFYVERRRITEGAWHYFCTTAADDAAPGASASAPLPPDD